MGTWDEKVEAALRSEEWYHGGLPKEAAERFVSKDGHFLVVRSEDAKGAHFFVIVFGSGDPVQPRKLKVRTSPRGDLLIFPDQSFPDLPALVNYYWRDGHPLGSEGMSLKEPVHRSVWELPAQRVHLIRRIGQGAFGEVWKGILVPQALDVPTTSVAPSTMGGGSSSGRGAAGVATTFRNSSNPTPPTISPKHGRDVAVKVCKDKTVEGRAKFEKECLFQLKFAHANVVETLGVVWGDELMMVLEFMSKGSLLSYLRKNRAHITAETLLSLSRDAARGMAYLEKIHIIHRDVAARNCLINSQTVLKIADFGLAKSQEKYKMLKGKLAIKWMAPDSMKTGEFTTKTDVWSFGVLLWEIYSLGKEPYPGLRNAEVTKRIVNGYRMPPPTNAPPLVVQTIRQCWAAKPADRPTFAAILHRFENAKP